MNKFFKNYSKKLANQDIIIPSSTKKSYKYFLLFVIIALIFAGLTMFLILPRATVTLIPKTELIQQEMKVMVSLDEDQINYQTNTIPGKLVTLEEKFIDRFLATGQDDFSRLARGKILVYNEFRAMTLIPSRFETPEGLIFLSQENVKLKLGVTELEVVAEKPGEEYNIGPTTFVLPALREAKSPRYNLIYAKSEQDFSGGLDKSANIINQEDIEKAEQVLQEQALAELRSQTDLNLLEPSVQIINSDFSTSLEPGEEAEAFNAILEINMQALAFQASDLKDLVSRNLLLKSRSGRQALSESLKLELLDSGSGLLEVLAQQEIYQTIDKTVLAENLAGKDKPEVQELLSDLDNIISSQVNFWPFWVKQMPHSINKIKIKINLD